jgi:hypothetical protein
MKIIDLVVILVIIKTLKIIRELRDCELRDEGIKGLSS